MTVHPNRFPSIFSLALVVVLVFGIPGAPTLSAQDGVVNTPPPPSDTPQDTQSPEDSATVIKSRVNVVQGFFNVKDKHGALVPGLLNADFQILEDGKPQTIKYFSAEANQPLTLGILVDTSGSQERVLGMEKEMGALF